MVLRRPVRPLHLAAAPLVRAVLGASAAALVACGGEPTSADLAGADGGAEAGCTDGSDGCGLVVADTCPAGSAPRIGERGCAPVGPTACAEGFVADPSGWGCAPVVTPEACTGATRASLGADACVPVGDCDAPFPPPGTTHHVSPTFTTDRAAGRYRTIVDAVLDARTRAGAVLAIDSGSYGDYFPVERPMTIVGRCAARVVVFGTGRQPGIQAASQGVVIRGITFRNHREAVGVLRGGSLVLEDVVVERAVFGAVSVLEGSRLELRRSVLRDVVPEGDQAGGLTVTEGSEAVLEDVTLERVPGVAILASRAATRVTADRVLVRDVTPAPKGEAVALAAAGGAALDGRRVAVERSFGTGAAALGEASVSLEASSFRDLARSPLRDVAHGLVAHATSTVVARGVTVARVEGIGVRASDRSTVRLETSVVHASVPRASDGDFGVGAYASGASRLELADAALVDNRRSGLELHDPGTSAVAERFLVAGTRAAPGDANGRGIYADPDTELGLADGAVNDNLQFGIYANAARRIDVTRVTVRRTQLEPFEARLGHGVLVVAVPEARLTGVELAGNASAGLAAVGSGVLLASSWVRTNAVGVLTGQDATLAEVPDGQDAVTVGIVAVTRDVRFEANEARTGGGIVPVPAPVTTVSGAP